MRLCARLLRAWHESAFWCKMAACSTREYQNRPGNIFRQRLGASLLLRGLRQNPGAQAALSELCRIYWRPVYVFLRRSGYDSHDAQDMTQSFFQHLLENETLRRVSREKGRFRSFLIGVLKRCLAHEQMQRHTLKRGGRTQFISTDDLHSGGAASFAHAL